jgi:hypothetical protein
MGQVYKSRQAHISKKLWAGGMVQAVECLPSKCKVLSSNPNTTKKKKKKFKYTIDVTLLSTCF